MAHYLVDGIKVPAVRKPNVGEIMYGETAMGKGINAMTGVENVIMQFLVSIRRFPELMERYPLSRIVDLDNGLEFDVISPISDESDEKGPEMIPDPTARADETERSGLSESTPIPPQPLVTGSTYSTSVSTSVGHPKLYEN